VAATATAPILALGAVGIGVFAIVKYFKKKSSGGGGGSVGGSGNPSYYPQSQYQDPSKQNGTNPFSGFGSSSAPKTSAGVSPMGQPYGGERALQSYLNATNITDQSGIAGTVNSYGNGMLDGQYNLNQDSMLADVPLASGAALDNWNTLWDAYTANPDQSGSGSSSLDSSIGADMAGEYNYSADMNGGDVSNYDSGGSSSSNDYSYYDPSYSDPGYSDPGGGGDGSGGGGYDGGATDPSGGSGY
jgi:hypothetical protein